MLHSRLHLSLVVALSLTTLASADSITVNMTFQHPGTSVYDGYYNHPYYSAINGGKATQDITANAVAPALDKSALFLAQHASSSEFQGLALYTPVRGCPGYRLAEFIGGRMPRATPEPGSLMLLSTGLVGVAGMMRRKMRRG